MISAVEQDNNIFRNILMLWCNIQFIRSLRISVPAHEGMKDPFKWKIKLKEYTENVDLKKII